MSVHYRLPGLRLLHSTAAKHFWARNGALIEALPGRLPWAPVEAPVEAPAGRPAAVSPG